MPNVFWLQLTASVKAPLKTCDKEKSILIQFEMRDVAFVSQLIFLPLYQNHSTPFPLKPEALPEPLLGLKD